MPIITAAQCRRVHTSEGRVLDEWIASAEEGIDILVRGQDDGPEQEALATANLALSIIDELQTKAVRLLESFMRDKGTWYLGSIDVGIAAAKQDCDLLLDLSFEAENDPHEYGYTYFSVCFRRQDKNPPRHNKPHPYKFVVEFR